MTLCFAAVTYHELFKLAARDAISTLQCDAWRRIYRLLDQMGNEDGELSADEVHDKIRSDQIRDIR